MDLIRPYHIQGSYYYYQLQFIFPQFKEMFASGLRESLNHSEIFAGNLRELSTTKIVCRKLAELLNEHIFKFMSHFNAV